MAHEQRFDGGAAGVQRRKGAKDHGRRREAGRIDVDAEQLVQPGQAGWRAGHGVVGRREAVLILVPLQKSVSTAETMRRTGREDAAERDAQGGEQGRSS